jgi:hypothetical protein
LQFGMKIALAVACTGGPRRTLGPRVVTNKYMVLKCGQSWSPRDSGMPSD